MSYVFMYIENEHMNPFISTCALSTQIDNYNGDNFDHTGLGFLSGADILELSDQGMTDRVPDGTKMRGSQWKKPTSTATNTTPDPEPEHLLRPCRKLPVAGPELQRCQWPTAATYDLRIQRKRPLDGAFRARPYRQYLPCQRCQDLECAGVPG